MPTPSNSYPFVYLNAGTHSVCPPSVIDAQIRFLQNFEKNPSDIQGGLFGIWKEMDKIQKQVAHEFGVDAASIFLRPNITQGLNDFILHCSLPKDSEILVTELEYGAIVNVCRLRAKRDNLTLRAAKMCRFEFEGLSDEEIAHRLFDDLITQVSRTTSLILISHVFTPNGVVFPVQQLADWARARGITVVVDGAHSPGALDFKILDLGPIDFFGGNFHKWMLGPKGSSFGWTHPRHHESLAQPFGSWTAFETPKEFEAFGNGDPSFRFAARMLQSASQDFSPYAALPAMFEFWKKEGAQKIFAQLKLVQSQIYTQIKEAGFFPLSPPPSSQWSSPLVAFDLPDHLQHQGRDLMWRCLHETNVQIGMTYFHDRWRLRLSGPYNLNPVELKEALNRVIDFL